MNINDLHLLLNNFGISNGFCQLTFMFTFPPPLIILKEVLKKGEIQLLE